MCYILPINLKNLKMDEVIDKFIMGLEELHLREKIEKIYLFGSRAKGVERPDSDYDLLLVIKNTEDVNRVLREKLYDLVMDVLLETGRLISLKIFKKEKFEDLCSLETPFIENVLKEGVKVG